MPGSFIGAYTWVMPTAQIRGFVEREKRVFPIRENRIEENTKVELK